MAKFLVSEIFETMLPSYPLFEVSQLNLSCRSPTINARRPIERAKRFLFWNNRGRNNKGGEVATSMTQHAVCIMLAYESQIVSADNMQAIYLSDR